MALGSIINLVGFLAALGFVFQYVGMTRQIGASFRHSSDKLSTVSIPRQWNDLGRYSTVVVFAWSLPIGVDHYIFASRGPMLGLVIILVLVATHRIKTYAAFIGVNLVLWVLLWKALSSLLAVRQGLSVFCIECLHAVCSAAMVFWFYLSIRFTIPHQVKKIREQGVRDLRFSLQIAYAYSWGMWSLYAILHIPGLLSRGEKLGLVDFVMCICFIPAFASQLWLLLEMLKQRSK